MLSTANYNESILEGPSLSATEFATLNYSKHKFKTFTVINSQCLNITFGLIYKLKSVRLISCKNKDTLCQTKLLRTKQDAEQIIGPLTMATGKQGSITNCCLGNKPALNLPPPPTPKKEYSSREDLQNLIRQTNPYNLRCHGNKQEKTYDFFMNRYP